MLSFVALAVSNVAIGATSLLSVPIIEALGMRRSLALSTVIIAASIGACVTQVGWILITVAPLLGAAFALMYNTQSSFCARLGTPQTMGRILGLFWTIANSGMLFGNLIVSYLTGIGVSLRALFIGGLVWLAVPFVMCFFLPAPPLPRSQTSPATSPAPSDASPSDSSSVPHAAVAPSRLSVLRHKLAERARRALGILGMLKRREVLLLCPMMITIGTFATFYSARLNPLLGPELAGIVWFVNILLRVSLTLPCGWLADNVDGAVLTVVAWAFFFATNVCVFFFFEVNKRWLFFLGFVFEACGEASNWSAVLSPSLSRDFEDVEAIFALYRMSWPIGQITTLLISPLVSVRAFDVAHTALFTFSFATLFAYCILRRRTKKKKNAADDENPSLEEASADGTTATADGIALVYVASQSTEIPSSEESQQPLITSKPSEEDIGDA